MLDTKISEIKPLINSFFSSLCNIFYKIPQNLTNHLSYRKEKLGMSNLRRNISSEQVQSLSVMLTFMKMDEEIKTIKSDFYAKIEGMDTEIDSQDKTGMEEA